MQSIGQMFENVSQNMEKEDSIIVRGMEFTLSILFRSFIVLSIPVIIYILDVIPFR